MKSLIGGVLLSALLSVVLLFDSPRSVGNLCSDSELATVQALGCGGWPVDSWYSCSAENSSWAWMCEFQTIPFFGTECAGSEMCPGASCYGPKNEYCGGWTWSGKMCTTSTVMPCCTITSKCETRRDTSGAYPVYDCDCANTGSWAMGSRTVATLGATCGGGGGGGGTQPEI